MIRNYSEEEKKQLVKAFKTMLEEGEDYLTWETAELVEPGNIVRRVFYIGINEMKYC